MKITIFWTWYVWLVTGTCLAEVGHEVMCIDIDNQKVEDLKKWIIPIYEPWLEELVIRNLREWRLHFITDAQLWVEFATAIFSAVGTPPDKNHRADLQYVKAVAETVGTYMNEYKVFINKSTVPVWTGEICREIIRKKGNIPFDIVSNPEFLKEWVAVRDFMLPDRIVCWVESGDAKKIMKEIYKPFVRTNRPLVFTDIKSAEIIKYAANAFLATKISFINEIANFAELAWANISDISKWIGLDDRIGSRFLHAWIGYGWSCFPKDVQALIETGKDFDYDFEIIKSVEKVNEQQKLKVVEKLVEKINNPLNNSPIIPFPKGDELKWKTIAIWGLAFKPKTDDIRDAPSLAIIDRLLELWVDKIQAFDPVAMSNVEKHYSLPHLDSSIEERNNSKLVLCQNNYEALQSADALLIVTEWDEFRMSNFEKISNTMNWNIIIDWRNIWNKEEVESYWFIYEGIWK